MVDLRYMWICWRFLDIHISLLHTHFKVSAFSYDHSKLSMICKHIIKVEHVLGLINTFTHFADGSWLIVITVAEINRYQLSIMFLICYLYSHKYIYVYITFKTYMYLAKFAKKQPVWQLWHRIPHVCESFCNWDIWKMDRGSLVCEYKFSFSACRFLVVVVVVIVLLLLLCLQRSHMICH